MKNEKGKGLGAISMFVNIYQSKILLLQKQK
jgi:hypothetical protein